MKYADLHIHSKFSDGTLSPEEIVREAKERGLSCIAITDHDTLSAIEPAIKWAKEFDIELVPGIELAAEKEDFEMHILGYFIDWQAEWFKAKLKQIREIRRKRALSIIDKLRDCGIDLDPTRLLEKDRVSSIGRLHIARMMREKGFVSSIQEAFNKYIGNNRPCFVKKFRFNPAEAIEMIRKLKGVAVLAHPYNIGKEGLIAELAQAGLRGIEVYYPEHNEMMTEHYRNLAQKYGLLITGGSDCHGLGRERITMGEIRIPYSLVEALKKEAELLKK